MKRTTVAASLLALTACAPNEPPLVCDPSRAGEIVFGYMLVPDPSDISATAVLVENGLVSLFVDGACNYWALNGLAPPAVQFTVPRQGTLTAAQLEHFNDAIMERPWSTLPAVRGTEPVAWRRTTTASCSPPCEYASTDLGEIADESRHMAEQLFDEGAPIAPADTVRLNGVSTPDLAGFEPTPWNGPTPLSDLVPTAEEIEARPNLYGDWPTASAADATELRQIRAYYTSGDVDFSFRFLPVSDDGLDYLVYVRESLPFEDWRGLVRPRPVR